MADIEHGEKTYGTIIPQKEYVWEEKARSLREIVSLCHSRLPLAVKFVAGSGELSKYTGPQDDKGQTDRIYNILELRRKKIILARKLQWDKTVMDYMVTGDQIEVPASYKGMVLMFCCLPIDALLGKFPGLLQSFTLRQCPRVPLFNCQQCFKLVP
ncbi:hypothetical protein SNE40_011973 [Patella caerulea]|uniref:Uncharacterized protein n=1 Tax=Patella caerulea TaxID=87958 RepID=A0AAN8JPE8_PATCE